MKLVSVQLLRAIAAWMVVFHHYMQLGHGDQYASSVGKFFIDYGSFGIDIFFVVSGFIMFYTISLKDYSVRSFLVGRIFRIVPAYWFATLTLLLAALIYQASFSWTDWTLESLALSLLFIPNENPSGIGTYPFLTVGWTLNIEMFFYAMLGLCLTFGHPKQFLICGMLLLVTPYLWEQNWPYGDVLANRMLKEFVFGLLIGQAYLQYPRSWKWAQGHPAIALILLGMSITLLSLNVPGARAFAASGLLIAGLCLELIVGGERKRVSNLFTHFGDISYSTYLFHPIIIPVVFFHYGEPDKLISELVLLCVCITCVYGVSIASFRLVESSRGLSNFARRLS